MQKSKIIIAIAAIILATAATSGSAKINNENILYSISLNKDSFLPMEPIIVIQEMCIKIT